MSSISVRCRAVAENGGNPAHFSNCLNMICVIFMKYDLKIKNYEENCEPFGFFTNDVS